jgi:hypothetical protein
VVPHGEHLYSGGEGGRMKELEQASWITLTWAMILYSLRNGM